MKIPAKFRCANREWRVAFVAEVDEEGSTGETRTRDSTILILESLSAEQRLQTFAHELVHVLAEAMGWRALDKREHKVDAIAGLLAQALETME